MRLARTRSGVITVTQERNRLNPRPGPVLVEDRLGRVLNDVRPAHRRRRVRSAAVEDRAREAHDAARRDNGRYAGVIAEVPDHVACRLVSPVWHDLARARARVREHVHGAVGLGDFIEGDPARQVRRVRVGDVAGVLVPRAAGLTFSPFTTYWSLKRYASWPRVARQMLAMRSPRTNAELPTRRLATTPLTVGDRGARTFCERYSHLFVLTLAVVRERDDSSNSSKRTDSIPTNRVVEDVVSRR